MKLIAALGNPGEKYAQTRHNVGWLVADELVRRAGAGWRKQPEAETCELRLGQAVGQPGEKVLLVKPLTYMNASGRAVVPLLTYYRLDATDLLVVQDDLDSPFGLMKLKLGGRHGGQNGVRDIIRLLGTQDFARLKLGISRPPAGRDPADWVLSKWAEEERTPLGQLVGLGADAAGVWATQGLEAAQGRYNSTDLRPRPPAPPVTGPNEGVTVSMDSDVEERGNVQIK
ncbi:aminoacyl-tRNA hydrolase [Deinococcus radiophilus]|uniref:Peptidyl-tRNA hydrolase n=1 Tax=Deinococcus radiophilus TaxID=32062 RepID=A0A3S0I8F0_9DEIO|nr:aminoacyl-tRNA hydrolase [Deinococcus radiophilus]RTR29815.1 aminoacyl-tRNA hydrolase [Deinococcus radiophilus]UFA49835.1 aminoacyl-tRNA hydrolase [Deinococcus radiophilus]